MTLSEELDANFESFDNLALGLWARQAGRSSKASKRLENLA